MAYDAVVVGGGAVGCSAAYHLALAGARVAVVERDGLGSGASGAAAGMLAPQLEAFHKQQPGGGELDELFDLMLLSRNLYPGFGGALLEATGIDIELLPVGTVRPAESEEQARAQAEDARRLNARGGDARVLAPDDLRAFFPALAGAGYGGLHLQGDHQVQPPRVVQAMAAAILALGGEILEGVAVTGFLRTGSRITGVATSRGNLAAGTVVLATGSWSAEVGRLAGLHLPVFPVKGQLLAVQAPAWARRPVLYAHNFYAVAKRDGRIILGATEEPEAGFDRRPTLGAVVTIGAAVRQLAPQLAEVPLVAHWASLRPGTPDKKPMLGWAPGVQGLIVATGHFRNGVLLTPVTGQIVAALAAGKEPPVDLDPFSPARFA